ncbi:hypothetical protein [Aurantibacter sp.]|uniref:hypothetical protein n=1 Tax=Aurantibacter sp. TaxID=2807103 RepID=UPI00326560D0
MSLLNSVLQRTSSIKSLFVLFIVSHLVLLAMLVFTFPVINNQIETKAFDLQTFGYSMATAESIVNNLDEQTTGLYLFPQLTLLDLFYPFLLALFLGSLLFRLFKISDVKNKVASIVLVIPFLAMLFDYLENICIILLITRSVEVSETIVLLASTFTVLKGVLTSIAWVTIVVYAINWLMLKIKKKSVTQPKKI